MQSQSRLMAFVAGFVVLMLTGFPLPSFPQRPPAAAEDKPAREDGLYMKIVTEFGDIHCKLFEKETPHTVRMIVGLALGTQPYIDPKTRKEVDGKRFYDGLTFHRVDPKFMIQGGDPLGSGYGEPRGPGFPFHDEFVPNLKFDVPGRLAMANAGRNTNGSQFFITVVPATYLNGRNTIFGQCTDLDVINAIARVPAKGERPLKPVVIKKVDIERVGPAPPDAPEAAVPPNQ